MVVCDVSRVKGKGDGQVRPLNPIPIEKPARNSKARAFISLQSL
jgi:hypothetical protein